MFTFKRIEQFHLWSDIFPFLTDIILHSFLYRFLIITYLFSLGKLYLIEFLLKWLQLLILFLSGITWMFLRDLSDWITKTDMSAWTVLRILVWCRQVWSFDWTFQGTGLVSEVIYIFVTFCFTFLLEGCWILGLWYYRLDRIRGLGGLNGVVLAHFVNNRYSLLSLLLLRLSLL